MRKSSSSFVRCGIAVGLGVIPVLTGSAPLLAQQPSPEDAPSAPDAPRQAPAVRQDGKPWLGVGLETRQECRPDAEEDCRVIVLIRSVVVGSPAEAAGVEVGDMVVSLDEAAPGSAEFRAHLDGMEVGKPVVMKVTRAGRPVSIDVVPAPRPPKPMHVRARPPVRTWTTDDGEIEVKVPIVIEPEGAPEGPGWVYRSDSDKGFVVVVPSEDGWRVQVFSEDAEGQAELEEALKKQNIELRELEQQMENVEEEATAAVREQARYWGRVKAELGPEMAALRDSVLAEARAKLAEVRKARQAYRTAERARYAPPAHLVEATRRIAGAEFEPLGPELRHEGLEQGLLVLRVISGTPAWDLGLRRGDVVTEVAGAECREVSDLRAALLKPGEESVTVKWVRNGESMTGTVDD
ncbi:MAG: PDZ domain-containing protein [Gemmatimonadales bacterium]